MRRVDPNRGRVSAAFLHGLIGLFFVVLVLWFEGPLQLGQVAGPGAIAFVIFSVVGFWAWSPRRD